MHRPNRVSAMSVNGVCIYGGSKNLIGFIFSKRLTRANLTQYQQFLVYTVFGNHLSVLLLFTLCEKFSEHNVLMALTADTL